MKVRIVQRPQFKIDVIEKAVRIKKDNPDAARRFIFAVDETLKFLAKNRKAGVTRKFGKTRIEQYPVIRPFNKYLIFFDPIENGAEFVQLLHSRQDIPSYFK